MKNTRTIRQGNTQEKNEVAVYKHSPSRMSLSGISTTFAIQGGDPRVLRTAKSGMTPLLDAPSPAPTGHPLPPGARGTFSMKGNGVVGQALPDNAPAKGHTTRWFTPRPSSSRSVSMRNIGAAHGFTLIELLVAVLIIGILAAVALPQYQKVVEKSVMTEGVTVMRKLVEAQKMHYLQNNSYASTFDELYLEVPGGKNAAHVREKETDERTFGKWAAALETAPEIAGHVVAIYVRRVEEPYGDVRFNYYFSHDSDRIPKGSVLCWGSSNVCNHMCKRPKQIYPASGTPFCVLD